MSNYVSVADQRLIKERAFGYCEYCYAHSGFSNAYFTHDHIHPVSLGGDSDLTNLCLCCVTCNNHKYNKTVGTDPLSNTKVALFHPREDYWLDHFVWNEDETLVLGITPKGRATVECLKVNRDGVVNIRILMQMAGLHPPKEYPKD